MRRASTSRALHLQVREECTDKNSPRFTTSLSALSSLQTLNAGRGAKEADTRILIQSSDSQRTHAIGDKTPGQERPETKPQAESAGGRGSGAEQLQAVRHLGQLCGDDLPNLVHHQVEDGLQVLLCDHAPSHKPPISQPKPQAACPHSTSLTSPLPTHSGEPSASKHPRQALPHRGGKPNPSVPHQQRLHNAPHSRVLLVLVHNPQLLPPLALPARETTEARLHEERIPGVLP
jgi:hypothetical protein